MIKDFSIVWSERSLIFSGLTNTVVLSVFASIVALALGALLSTLLMHRKPVISVTAKLLVDLARSTPFLLFAYIVYFGLPALGLQFSAWISGLFALTFYHAAYMGEILRAAWISQPQAPIEAGVAFGYRGLRLFRRIVLPPLALSAAQVAWSSGAAAC